MNVETGTTFKLTSEQLSRIEELARRQKLSQSDLMDSLISAGEAEFRRNNTAALMNALEACWKAAEENGTADMSMEEINAEIAAYRAERRLIEAA